MVHSRARAQKGEDCREGEKNIYQKTPRWVRGEICPLERKGQGRKTKGESACSGVELDISVSCQRLVHGCGMLMSEVSRLFSLLPLFLYPPPPCPPLSLGLLLWEEKSGSIADPMVWPVLYLSDQAMILSALNVIYSKRLPKSTQRDPLTQRSGLSHSHLALSLSFFSATNARTHAYSHG